MGWHHSKPFLAGFDPRRHSSALLNNEDIARAMEMRRSGAKLREIAAELAVCESTVSKLLTGRTFGGKGKVADPQPRGKHRRAGQS